MQAIERLIESSVFDLTKTPCKCTSSYLSDTRGQKFVASSSQSGHPIHENSRYSASQCRPCIEDRHRGTHAREQRQSLFPYRHLSEPVQLHSPQTWLHKPRPEKYTTILVYQVHVRCTPQPRTRLNAGRRKDNKLQNTYTLTQPTTNDPLISIHLYTRHSLRFQSLSEIRRTMVQSFDVYKANKLLADRI